MSKMGILLEADYSSIVTWMNVGLIILTVLVFLDVILAFIAGWKRGIIKTGYQLVFISILFLIACLTLKAIANWVGTFDISGICKMFGATTITVSGQYGTSTITITTLFETISNFFYSYLMVNGIELNPITAAQLAQSLTSSLLAYALFLLDGILISTLGMLFCSIMWHALFKRLFKKETLEKVRIKGLSGACQIVKTLLIISMLFVPITAVVNAANQGIKKANISSSSNSTIATISTFADAYNNSFFANFFFNWTVNGEGMTIDTAFMDLLTSSDFNGTTASVVENIDNFVTIGTILIDNGVISTTGSGINMSIVYSDEAIAAILQELGDSGLITAILPIVLNILLNMDGVSSYINADYVNMSDIDWSSEINNVVGMYNDIIGSGILEQFIDPDTGEMLEFSQSELVHAMVSDKVYSSYMSLFSKIDSSKLLSRMVSAVCYTVANNDQFNPTEGLGLSAFLPTNWSDYSSIKWGQELGLLYDTVYNVNKVDSNLLDTLMFTSGDSSTIIDAISANFGGLKKVLIGETDDSGKLKYLDENGYSIVYDTAGNKIEGRRYNLFDSNLISYALPGITQYLLTNVLASTVTIDNDKVDAIIDDLGEGTPILNYKTEFNSIFSVAQDALASEQVKAFIQNPTGYDGLKTNSDGHLVVNEDFVNDLSAILPAIDDSKILTLVFPKLMKSVVDSSLSSSLAELGMDSSSFLWESQDDKGITIKIGQEMANLVKALPHLATVQSYIGNGSDASNILSGLSKDEESFNKVLDTFYNSQIINPKFTSDITINGVSFKKGQMVDDNYYNLIDYLFSELLEQYGFSWDKADWVGIKWANSVDANGDYLTNTSGEKVYDGENGYLINFFKEIYDSGLYDYMANPSTSSISTLSGTGIRDLFYAIGDSQVISKSISNALDENLLKDLIGDEVTGVSFNNVTDWYAEGDNMKILFDTLSSFNIELNNLDLVSLDPDGLNTMLDSLADSQIFYSQSTKEYNFYQFMWYQLNKSLGDYFYDADSTTTKTLALSDFKGVDSLEASVKDKQAAWHIENSYLCDVIASLQNAVKGTEYEDDPLAGLTSGKLSKDALKGVLLAMNDTSTLRMVIFNAYDDIKTQMSSSFDLSSMNTKCLINMTKADRAVEINYSLEGYDAVSALNGDDSGNISLDNFTDSQVESILKGMHKSKVFNTFYVTDASGKEVASYRTGNQMTVFESAIEMLLKGTDMYDKVVPMTSSETSSSQTYIDKVTAHIISIGNKVADTPITSDGWANGDSLIEIEKLVNLVSSARNFVDSSGVIDLSYDKIKEVVAVSGGDVKVKDFFASIDESSLCARVLAANLHDSFSTLTISSSIDVDPSAANFFFNNVDQNPMNDYVSYCEATGDNTDTDLLVEIVKDFIAIENLDSSDVTSFVDNATSLKKLLTDTHASTIFNTKGVAYDCSSTQTLFQQFVNCILNTTFIKDNIYLTTSPKDKAATTTYSDAETKINYIIDDVFSLTDIADSTTFNTQVTEINKVVAIIESIPTSALSGNTLDFDSVTSSDISGILIALNNSSCTYDVVPNYIRNVCHDSINIDDINVNAGNYFFAYYSTDRGTGTLANPDYSARYNNSLDIEPLADLLIEMRDMGDIINDPSSPVTNLNLTDLQLEQFNATLVDLNKSIIFHDSGDAAPSSIQESPSTDVTIFEQMMIKIYTDSGLAAKAYDSTHDTTYSSAKEKLNYIVTNFKDLFDNHDGMSNGIWDNEIYSIFTSDVDSVTHEPLGFVKSVMTYVGAGSNIGSVDTSSLTPDSIYGLLYGMNRIDATNDAVPNTVKEAYANVNMADFNIYPGETADLANYYIGQSVYKNTELGLIKSLLNSMYNSSTSTYFDLNGGLSSFTENSSSVELLHYLTSSKIYATEVSRDGGSFLLRDVFYYNVMDDSHVSKYINGDLINNVSSVTSEYAKKMVRIKDLFTTSATSEVAFNYTYEGLSLDRFIADAASFSDNFASAGDKAQYIRSLAVATDSDVIGNLFHNTYKYYDDTTSSWLYYNGATSYDACYKAQLTSEVTAGIVDTDILDITYTALDYASMTDYTRVDMYLQNYFYINDYEVVGLKNGVMLSEVTSASSTNEGYFTALDIADTYKITISGITTTMKTSRIGNIYYYGTQYTVAKNKTILLNPLATDTIYNYANMQNSVYTYQQVYNYIYG